MSRIRIQSLSLNNFRSIAECTVDLSRGVAGLVGVNAAGKTNVGRGAAFFFNLIQQSLMQIKPTEGKSMNASLPMSEMRWQPLNVEPTALLAEPVAGNRLAFKVTCALPPSYLPDGKGELLRNLNREKDAHELTISCDVQARNLPTGELKLVPTFDVTISTKQMYFGDLQALQALWQLFVFSRIQAMRPATEFLNALKQLRDSGVPGHRSFDRLNETVQALDPNFARLSFISNGPIAIEGDIPDLTVDNMSSGNLRAMQILSMSKNPELEKTILLHVEEPETHFHPSLQRSIVREVINICQPLQMPVLLETHSPHVIAELYSQQLPVYRVEVSQRKDGSRVRTSKVAALPRGTDALRFLNTMGFEAGFAVLGGTVLIVDGVTDVPVYRTFLSRFPEVTDCPIIFLPIGSLESAQLDLSDIIKLAGSVAVIADGHFLQDHGARLEQDCKAAGIEYIPLSRWGIENFYSEEVLRQGAEKMPTLRLGDEISLDPMKRISDTPGVQEFSKKTHNMGLAQLVTKEYLEDQKDFMMIVEFVKREATQQKNPPYTK